MERTSITLIRVLSPYSGILRYEARPSTSDEIGQAEGVYDFQGKTQRIAVLPCGCELTRDKALEIATRYSQQPFETLVDFSEYSQQAMQSLYWRGVQERNHKAWKPKRSQKHHQFPDSTTQTETESEA